MVANLARLSLGRRPVHLAYHVLGRRNRLIEQFPYSINLFWAKRTRCGFSLGLVSEVDANRGQGVEQRI